MQKILLFLSTMVCLWGYNTYAAQQVALTAEQIADTAISTIEDNVKYLAQMDPTRRDEVIRIALSLERDFREQHPNSVKIGDLRSAIRSLCCEIQRLNRATPLPQQQHPLSVQVPGDVEELQYGILNFLHNPALVPLVEANHVDFSENSRLSIIGDAAFLGLPIKTITIPDSVQELGWRCFSCSPLTNANFSPNSTLKTIREGAFSHCEINAIAIPSTVEKINKYAFAGSPLTSITFHKDSQLQSIGWGAFIGCKFSSIVIPKSVEKMGEHCLFGSKVVEVIFEEDSRITELGTEAFAACSNLTSITVPDSLRELNLDVFLYSPIETVKVICQRLDHDDITHFTIDRARRCWLGAPFRVFQVALASSLIDKLQGNLPGYVQAILGMNTTLTKSAAEKSGFCKLDLSNTPLTEDDIDSMEKQLSCSWEITFAGGRTKLYTPTPPPAG